MGVKALTPEGRLSFPHLITARKRTDNGVDKYKYEMTLLIPKTAGATTWVSDANLNGLKAAILEVRTDKWGADKAKLPKLRYPVLDGDEADDMGGSRFTEECFGHWVIRASDTNKPLVVGPNPKIEISDASEIYSGCWVMAQLDAYAYDRKDGKGITFGIKIVQKRRDGEPLGDGPGARDNPADVFENVSGIEEVETPPEMNQDGF